MQHLKLKSFFPLVIQAQLDQKLFQYFAHQLISIAQNQIGFISPDIFWLNQIKEIKSSS